MEKNWRKISNSNYKDLKVVRNQLHKSIQLIAATGRSFSPPDPGDVYGSLVYENDELSSRLLVNGIRFSLNIPDFCFKAQIGDQIEKFHLNNKSQNEAKQWITSQLEDSGLNPEQYSLKLPYQIQDFGPSEEIFLKEPAVFDETNHYYHNTLLALEKVTANFNHASMITCWPHHFDLATLITLMEEDDPEDSLSIGIGMSPGDDNYDQPYFYLTPWPYPDTESIKDLELDHGAWHTKGWVGAVLLSEELVKIQDAKSQEEAVMSFIQSAYSHLVNLIL